MQVGATERRGFYHHSPQLLRRDRPNISPCCLMKMISQIVDSSIKNYQRSCLSVPPLIIKMEVAISINI